MARERIVAKYTSQNDEHYMGIPARDIGEEEFSRMSDEQKALLAESPFYSLRHDAPAAAEKAVKRVEKAESLQVGKETSFSAAEAAKGLEDLAKAGEGKK
jgi:hypothetical protein